MSFNSRHFDQEPDEVFAVLADPNSYGDWVVGSSQIHGVDGNWPTPGSTFHHTQGLPWIGPKDTTTVLEAQPPRRLLLRVRIRPWVVAEVELTLRADGGGTTVTMRETPKSGLVGRLHNPVIDLTLKLRNAESLRRLERLARKRSAT